MGDRPYAAIGHRIRALREINEMSQAAFAAKVYVTQSAVSQWENGHTVPARPMQHHVADVLRTSRSVLFAEIVKREQVA